MNVLMYCWAELLSRPIMVTVLLRSAVYDMAILPVCVFPVTPSFKTLSRRYDAIRYRVFNMQ